MIPQTSSPQRMASAEVKTILLASVCVSDRHLTEERESVHCQLLGNAFVEGKTGGIYKK